MVLRYNYQIDSMLLCVFFSNRLQMKVKCGKNKNVAHKLLDKYVTDVLTTFNDSLCDMLLNRGTATWSLFVL